MVLCVEGEPGASSGCTSVRIAERHITLRALQQVRRACAPRRAAPQRRARRDAEASGAGGGGGGRGRRAGRTGRSGGSPGGFRECSAQRPGRWPATTSAPPLRASPVQALVQPGARAAGGGGRGCTQWPPLPTSLSSRRCCSYATIPLRRMRSSCSRPPGACALSRRGRGGLRAEATAMQDAARGGAVPWKPPRLCTETCSPGTGPPPVPSQLASVGSAGSAGLPAVSSAPQETRRMRHCFCDSAS